MKIGKVNKGDFQKSASILPCTRRHLLGVVIIHRAGHIEAKRRGVPPLRTMLGERYIVLVYYYLVAPFRNIVIYSPKRGNRDPKGA